jgi:hypothetical protein
MVTGDVCQRHSLRQYRGPGDNKPLLLISILDQEY